MLATHSKYSNDGLLLEGKKVESKVRQLEARRKLDVNTK